MVNVVPKAKTRGPAGPEGFGRGTSLGTTFTMVPPRFFHKMSLLQLPGLVKRDFFQVGFGQWTPQGVQWKLYWGWRVNIGRVKSQCTSPGCYNNVHSTATAMQKLLHHFLYVLDPHPQAQNDRNGPSFPMVQVVSSGFMIFTEKVWFLS